MIAISRGLFVPIETLPPVAGDFVADGAFRFKNSEAGLQNRDSSGSHFKKGKAMWVP
jgi:hypothetical protein